jgi:iron complex outermembrane receptor protein
MKILSIPILLASSVALAQDKADQDQVTELEALTIESSPLGTKTDEITQAWSVLAGDDLDKAKAATIAETLSDTPGVSQTHFGPTANRPIIRGMDKFRVRMLQNGTDTFDVSAQSEDHAVPIDPLMIDRIEVLRGSSALLHGGSAIGGVVNVIDRSIPTSPYSSPGASLRSSYNSVNEGWNYGATAFGSSDKLSFQINGSKRDYKDYDTPTFLLENHDTEEMEAHNKVENSYGDSSSFGLGGSYMLDSGYAGLSFSSYESTYGVPGEHAELDTRIEMESDRFEFRSEIEVSDSGWLTGIDLNIGYGDYKHSEIGKEDHDDDELHTHATYLREGFEGKIAFEHEVGELRGVFGLHGLFDEFKIEGEESIFSGLSKDWVYDAISDTNVSTPSASRGPEISAEESSRIALFLLEEYDLSDNTTLNAGVRWESISRDYQGTADRDDSTFSASGGVSHDLSDLWNLSGNLSYAERTPDSAELYSDGAHHATESYEIGNPNLDNESAVGVEIIVRKSVGNVTGQFSAFHTRFNDYIFHEDTGNKRDTEGNLKNEGIPGFDHGFPPDTEALPEREYEAVDAEFQGLEIEIDWLAMKNPGWNLLLSTYGDILRGKNKTEGGNLPRIPAGSLGVGFEIQAEKLRFGMDLNNVFKQNRIAVHEEEEEEEEDDHEHGETATPSYSLLNAYASYDLNFGNSQGELFVRGTNLTDELALVHTSFLKNSAPLPGRSFEIGLKFDF